jgi:CTP synthase
LDPYLNVDPGTMSPYQHGEVFVTDDGAETDLDLGHYERFTHRSAKKTDSTSSGRIYSNVLKKERKGDYLGATIQVIPHVTDEIKLFINSGIEDEDIIIYEIGGTVGDIESLPFLEAIRQIRNDKNISSALIHMTYVPFLSSAGELKTKPTQHSVKELLNSGIQPDMIMCRCEKDINEESLEKISQFCNVKKDSVIPALNAKSIYEVPSIYSKVGLDRVLLEHLGYNPSEYPLNLEAWENLINKINKLQKEVTIGVVGKYTNLKDSYKSLIEALTHGGIENNVKVKIEWINAEKIETDQLINELKNVDGILIPGGFGYRGVEGKIQAIKFARENDIPFFGICLGMQMAVIEFARNVLNLKDSNSTEMNNNVAHPVIDLMKSQKNIVNKGGTMRLGSWECELKKSSNIREIYSSNVIHERHRHRYEFNNDYLDEFQSKGLIASGINTKTSLVEIFELNNHPWFIGVQFHPEYKSTVNNPHPLFVSFVKAGLTHSKSN